MSGLIFNIGASVYCKDGRCGRLKKVVVNPRTERITDLIVEKGFLLKRDRVLPVSVVERAGENEIHLSINSDQLDRYPEYHEEQFKVTASSQRWAGYEQGQVVQWTTTYGRYSHLATASTIRQRVQKDVPSELSVIGRGTPVKSVDGPVGTVHHLLVDRESGKVTHLVVGKIFGSNTLVIPFSLVKYINGDGICIEATAEELRRFPQYSPRASADILAEVRERLAAAVPDLSGVEATLENGVIRLTGLVRDIAAKRHAEAIARSVEGVIDVENALDTDTAIEARVVSALASHPETELAPIEVISDRGVITLRGEVDSPEVRYFAEQIAAEQARAAVVINELVVKPDKDTEFLKFRPIPISVGWASVMSPN